MAFDPNGRVVAILGATGVVGAQMMQCLEERNFPIKELVLLASARSAGKTIEFAGQQIVIREATPEAFEGCRYCPWRSWRRAGKRAAS